MLREVDSPHYHVWTDALLARHYAINAENDWDRGAFVRWTVNTAWTAFEIACGDLLKITGLGMRFKDRLTDALVGVTGQRPDWGQDIWQELLAVYEMRKQFTHVNVPQERLFAPVDDAMRAIDVLRRAAREIWALVGVDPPAWIEDDQAPVVPKSLAHGFTTHGGARRDDPTVVRIAYVFRGVEHTSGVFPADTDPTPHMEDLIKRIVIPISAVRAYVGPVCTDEITLRMRGA